MASVHDTALTDGSTYIHDLGVGGKEGAVTRHIYIGAWKRALLNTFWDKPA